MRACVCMYSWYVFSVGYACKCVYKCGCSPISLYIYIYYIHTCTNTYYIHICNVYMHACIFKPPRCSICYMLLQKLFSMAEDIVMSIYIYIYTHTYIHVYIYTHMHIQVHIYIHARYIQSVFFNRPDRNLWWSIVAEALLCMQSCTTCILRPSKTFNDFVVVNWY